MTLLDHFASPVHLILLALAIPLVVLLSWRSLAGLSPLRRRTSILLRILVVLCLGLALAEFRLIWENDRLAVLFVVDRSASIPPEHQDAVVEFLRDATAARDRERGDAVGVVSFGRTAGIERGAREDDLERGFSYGTLIEKDYTDIQEAIRLGLAAFPDGFARRIVLISDFNENRGDALEEARIAATEDVAIDTLSIRYDHEAEIRLDKLVVDPEVHIGEPFEIRIVVDSTLATRGTLRLFERGQLVHSQEVDLRPGKNVFPLTRRLTSSDLYDYEAVIEPAEPEADSLLQNNLVTGFTFIRGQPKVLLCSDDPALDADLIRALRAQRIRLDVLRPGSLPSDPVRYLQYDALLFSNVPAHAITKPHMSLVENLVKGAGLGFVMLGGDQSFGAGGYQGTPVEEALPVTMDAQQKKQIPNGALGIVMHSCEINNGNFWAKATIQQAIRVLSPRDYAGVAYYGGMGGESWLFPMMTCDRKQIMLNRLANFAPGDMPSFARIFALVHQGLKTTPAAIKHIIVFSDGDPIPPTPSQIAQIRADNITISTICMGAHSQPISMQKLAADGGGQFYLLTGPDKLPEIFVREATTVRKALIQEREFRPVGSGGSYLAGIDVSALPRLTGYVITSRKDQADHYLLAPPSDEDPTLDPILSSWHYGLGKSVAYTSDSGRRWAADWASWERYQQFWSQVVRWASRSRSDERFRVTRKREGDRGVIFVDAIDSAGRFINGIDFDATVITPDETAVETEVRQVGPGRYRADFPVTSMGVYITSFKYSENGEGKIYSTGMTVPYSPEFRQLATNDLLSRQIATTTGGRVLDPLSVPDRIEAIYRSDFVGSRSPQDLWRALLFLAAVLFLLDVFVRRVVVDYAEMASTVWARAAALLGRQPGGKAPEENRLQVLLRRKASVQQAASRRTFYSPETGGGQPEPTLDERYDAGAAQPAPRAAETRREAAESSQEPAEDGYTSRLLEAKRRALRKKDGEKDHDTG